MRIEADDADEILRDGQSRRYSLTMRDAAMHRAIDEVYPRQVKDAALHRPGFRPLSTTAARDAKRQAYQDYETRLCDEYRSPLGGNATDNPDTGFGSSGPKGSKPGDKCTRNGWDGVLIQGPGGQLFCQINPITGKDGDPDDDDRLRKKQKRNARGQEEGTEEYERDAAVCDAFAALARSAGLVDQGEEVDWDDVIRIARAINSENGDDDDDADAIVRAATTNTESTVRRAADHKTLDALRQESYRAYDEALANSWRRG